MILISWIVVYTLDSVIHCSNNAVPEPGGEETRSGMEKRCSHNMQSSHLALWSADIIVVFSQSNYFRSEKWASRGNNSKVEKIISWLFVFLAYRICPLILKLQNASDGHCNRIFLTENKARWTIDPVYRLHRFFCVRTWEDYRSYDVHKKFLDKVSLKFIGSLCKRALWIRLLSFIHAE